MRQPSHQLKAADVSVNIPSPRVAVQRKSGFLPPFLAASAIIAQKQDASPPSSSQQTAAMAAPMTDNPAHHLEEQPKTQHRPQEQQQQQQEQQERQQQQQQKDQQRELSDHLAALEAARAHRRDVLATAARKQSAAQSAQLALLTKQAEAAEAEAASLRAVVKEKVGKAESLRVAAAEALAANVPFAQLGGLLGRCSQEYRLPAWTRPPSKLGFRGLQGHDGDAFPTSRGAVDLAGSWYRPTKSSATKVNVPPAFIDFDAPQKLDISSLRIQPQKLPSQAEQSALHLEKLQRQQRKRLLAAFASPPRTLSTYSHQGLGLYGSDLSLLPPRYFCNVEAPQHKLHERRQLASEEQQQRDARREAHTQKVGACC